MNRYNFGLLLLTIGMLVAVLSTLPAIGAMLRRVIATIGAVRINVEAIARVLGARRPASLTITRAVFIDERIVVEREIRMIRISDTQRVRVTFGKPVDKKNFPADVQEGSVQIVATDDSITVTPVDGDPFSADVIAQHPTTDITQPGGVKISADADLGDGVLTIEGFEPVLVSAGVASGFGSPTVGAPAER